MATDKKAYKAQYWKAYKKTHKRVYGSLSNKEYQAIETIAKANDRAVWTQIWLESCAYRNQRYLPSEAVEQELINLKVQLRKIGTNINQIAHQSNSFKKLMQQRQLLRQLQDLENVIETSVKQLKPSS